MAAQAEACEGGPRSRADELAQVAGRNRQLEVGGKQGRIVCHLCHHRRLLGGDVGRVRWVLFPL